MSDNYISIKQAEILGSQPTLATGIRTVNSSVRHPIITTVSQIDDLRGSRELRTKATDHSYFKNQVKN